MAESVDDVAEVLFAVELEDIGVVGFRLRHQPYPGPRDDAQVGLREHAFDVRADAPFVRVPRLERATRRRAAGLDQLARGKHDLHSTEVSEMVPVRRLADAAVECVAEHAPVGWTIRAVDPEAIAVFLEVAIEL